MKKYICPKCGYEVKKLLKFCPECGNALGDIRIENKDKIYICNIKNKISRVNKKKTIIVASIVAVMIIAVVVFLNIYNSNYNVFIRNYKSGNTEAIQDEYDKYKDSDVDKVYSFLSKKAQNTRDKFFNKSISYTEAIEEINQIQNCLKNDKILDNFTQCKSDIELLNKSRNSFNEAEEYYNNNQYENAYNSYRYVEEIDDCYQVAQAKMQELKPIIAKEYYEKAKSKYDSGSYTLALNDISNCLSYDTNSQYEELKKLCQESVQKEKAEKEELERQKKLLVSGKEIQSSKFNIEFREAKFTNRITADRLDRYYLYYSCDNDNMFLDMVFSVTNKSDYSAKIELITGYCATYGTKHYYQNSAYYCDAGSTDIDPVYSWTSIQPLETVTYHVVTKLPYEAVNSNESITVSFKIDGQEQLLEFR